MIKFEPTKANITIVALLLIFAFSGAYLFLSIAKSHEKLPPNVFKCKDQIVPFRANISSCLAFSAAPDREALADTLVSPVANSVGILVEPNSTPRIGLAATDIYKVYKSLEPRTNIVPGIAYTERWPEQPLVPNITIDAATPSSPIIWLRLNQTENKIVADGPKIYVNANTPDDLDAAACLISISVIKRVLSC